MQLSIVTIINAFFKIICVIFLLTYCSNSQRRFPYFGPRKPHLSPFESKKVILSQESFFEINGKLRTKKSLKLTAIIDNICAQNNCTIENQESLSCFLFKGQEYRKELKIQVYTFELSKSYSEMELEELVKNDKCLIGLGNENIYNSTSFNDEFYFSNQKSYLDSIKFEESLPYFNDKVSPVNVVVIDTGVGTHPDLSNCGDITEPPCVKLREDFRSNASKQAPECLNLPYTNEMPNNFHGTFVGGIIAAQQNNSIGIAGLANNTVIFSLTVGDCNGRIQSSEIANALLYSLQYEAEVVNMSLGDGNYDDPTVRYAVVQLLNNKAVVVNSAGNRGLDLRTNPMYPNSYSNNYPGFITVGWGNNNVEINPESNYSPNDIKILAPGSDIFSLDLSNGYKTASGSSASAPIVSAAVALTIGFLKKNSVAYDEYMIEHIVTKMGVDNFDSLKNFIRDGASLNMLKLGEALEFIRDKADEPRIPLPMTIKNQLATYDYSKRTAFLEFTVEWNVPFIHYGGRLGVFDLSCGYSKPCLIQDFDISSIKGEKKITLSRNELAPILATYTDPYLKLNIGIAIYYESIDPNTKLPKNNYGKDAEVVINLRDIDTLSIGRLKGNITNIRMDMQYLYIQGWACLEGSNKAAIVEVRSYQNDSAINTDFAYYYRYMMLPPSYVEKINSFSVRGGPFVAEQITAKQTNKSRYLAGLEANPMDIFRIGGNINADCRTLTVSHGFEFAIPLKSIKENALEGNKFYILAINPIDNNKDNRLMDYSGKMFFTFPSINYQPSIQNNINLVRQNNSISINGSIVSESPSPITIEYSFSEWDLKCRLKNSINFPDFYNSCSLVEKLKSPPVVYSPSLLSNPPKNEDRNKFANYYWDQKTNSPQKTDINLNLTQSEIERHISLYPTMWPNAFITLLSPSTSEITTNQYLTYLKEVAKIQEVDSGKNLSQIININDKLSDYSNSLTNQLEIFNSNRQNTSFISHHDSMYWDIYDIGEAFSFSNVAYEFDTNKTIGDYLFRTYNVKKVLRETKKFETPLGYSSHVLSVDSLNSWEKTQQDGKDLYTFNINKTIPDILEFTPKIMAVIMAFLLEGEDPITNIPIDDITTSMKEVPIDIRFFQDGVMILHLVSDFGANTIKVTTLER